MMSAETTVRHICLLSTAYGRQTPTTKIAIFSEQQLKWAKKFTRTRRISSKQAILGGKGVVKYPNKRLKPWLQICIHIIHDLIIRNRRIRSRYVYASEICVVR